MKRTRLLTAVARGRAARRWQRLLAATAGDAAPGGGAQATEHSQDVAPLGAGEGQVNLVAWAGYVEDGSTDPAVDWVSDFEAATGCQVNNKIGATSDEMVTLMKTGRVRRGVGVRRRLAAAHLRRRRRSGRTPT